MKIHTNLDARFVGKNVPWIGTGTTVTTANHQYVTNVALVGATAMKKKSRSFWRPNKQLGFMIKEIF